MFMIEFLFFTPVVLCILVFIFRSKALNITVTLLYAVIFAAAAVFLYFYPGSFTAYFRTDNLNIYFLLILAVLFLCTAVYNIGFMMHDKEDRLHQALYTIYLLMFTCSMAGVILATHLAMLWVFVEATTLSSAFLIYYYRTGTTIEAAWKYLFICSIGIALAFIGITLLSMGLGKVNSFFFSDLAANAKIIDAFWLKLSFPFILVGFGTKAGLAPVHAWLPDAHSESPSPISALLSGTLLNTALLGIIRMNKIMELADMGWYVKILLFVIGFLSLLVAAVYIRIVKNYKRLLAYSSIENMGIITIGLAAGGPGLFAAMLHVAAHSFTKGSLFLTSGNILHRYGTKDSGLVRGLLKGDSGTGWIWIFSLIAITGLPPFPMFISEFYIIKAFFQNGQYLAAAIFFLLLTVIMAAIFKNMLRMSFGEDSAPEGAGKSGLTECIPQIVLLFILLITGIALPDFIRVIIENAAAVL
ncbi:MAG: hydrogenase [Spirochaetes bacterium]|nr:hydrogenase [Spirochaetota bacterium]